MTTPKPNCVALISGGMDSVTLLHYLVRQQGLNPAAMSFLYGQKHQKEIACAKENLERLSLSEHQIVDLSPLKGLFENSALVSSAISIPDIEVVMGDPQPSTYVPNRNMIFLALAVAYAESLDVGDVYYGAQRHDIYGYWDTTPQFLDTLNQVYRLNRKRPVQIKAPFVQYSKADLLRIGLSLEVDYGKTWSCYAGDTAACGHCPTCAERLAAFHEVGIPDPLPYINS